MNLADPVDPKLWPIEDERQLWRWKCFDDLWWFNLIAGGALNYMEANPRDQGTISASVQLPYVLWLEGHHKEWFAWRKLGVKRRKKLMSVLPRFWRKTLLNTKFSDLWDHLHDPDMATALGSSDTDLASLFQSSKIAVTSGGDPFSWFCWLYGNWDDKDRKQGALSWTHGARKLTTRQEPSWYVFSIRSGLVGTHPDRYDIDDPVDYERMSKEETWLDTVNKAVDSARPALRTDGMANITMTRYHDNDPVGHFLKKEGIRSWTGDPMPRWIRENCVLSPEGEWDVYFQSALNERNESKCPAIITTEELRKFERSNPVHFSGQYRNDPTVGEHMVLTLEQAQECYITREALGEDILRHCTLGLLNDTAFKTRENVGKGDNTVGIVIGYPASRNGDVIFFEGFGNNLYRMEDYTEEVIKLFQRYEAMRHPISFIADERTIGGKGEPWLDYLRMVCAQSKVRMPAEYVLKYGSKHKHDHIAMTAPYWCKGHVKLLRGAQGAEHVVTDMVRLGYTEHDDWADCFHHAFHPDVYIPYTYSGQREDNPIPISPGDEYITNIGLLRKGPYRTPRPEKDSVIDTYFDSGV